MSPPALAALSFVWQTVCGGQAGYHFLPEFLRTTEQYYRASLAELDFKHDAEQARQSINQWVAEQTVGKIKDLLAPGVPNALSRLLLTNAIYFLGSWEKEFDEADTKDAPFWTTSTEQHTAAMMQQTGHFRYGEFDDLLVLEMLYRRTQVILASAEPGGTTIMEPVEESVAGSDLMMSILLPRDVAGLSKIERQLSPATLRSWTTLRWNAVKVHVPKFRIESSFSLGDTLTAMGMRKAFSRNEADFSRMSDDPEGLFMSDAIHKAVVNVNEKGTEAAAATGFAIGGGPSREPETFRADHPFLFLIRDRTTRLIHFMGRVTRPSTN